jgi:nitrate reductase gamma subunit
MTGWIYFVLYAGVAGFAAGSLARAVRYARQPLHLRWELYPVPHEEAERVRHGGSYFEEPDWWRKPLRINRLTELKFMLEEMLLLQGLWRFNRKLWRRSFPFHFGLYLTAAAAVVLLLAVSGFPALAPAAAALGTAGAVLAITGAAGLLLRRLRDPALRNYTAPGDIFNLLWFVAAFGLLGTGMWTSGDPAATALELGRGALRWDTTVEIPGLLAAGLIVSSLLLLYIPLTHMAHYVAKYFTYHAVRWDDLPAARAAELQKKFAEYLTYRPRWSAPHIRADGTRTWAEIAAANPHAEAKR